MKRRKNRTSRALVNAAKEVKSKKLQFERDASLILSQALGFQVTVKIKRQPLTATFSPQMRKFARKTKRELADQMNGAFAPAAPVPSLNDPLPPDLLGDTP